jgi:4-amino-4-deoxy-L-arabinose transferase-like glycosyltransferase
MELKEIEGLEAPRESNATRDGIPRAIRWASSAHNAIPILLIVSIALFLTNLGGYPLYTKGEPREAVTIYDIVHGGGVILPQRAGVEVPSKPLMMHWMGALVALAVRDVNEFAVRFPSAVLALAGVIALYGYVRRLFDEPTAFFAALMMATSVQYLQAGTGARVDMTLTFFMEVAFFEFIMIAEDLTRRRMTMYVAIAFAVLTKGPVGAILPALVAGVWIAQRRRWDVVSRISIVRGAALVMILAGGWYVGAIIEGGADFFRKQVLAENLFRMVGGSAALAEPHAHPFYYMELALLAGFMPWTMVAPVVGARAAGGGRVVDSRLAYIFTWFATVLIFYNIPHSKRGVYLLALYPALATICALYLMDAIRARDTTSRGVRIVGWAAGIATLALGAAGLMALGAAVRSPERLRAVLYALGIEAPGFVPALLTAISLHWIPAAAAPVALILIGATIIRARKNLAPIWSGIAAAMLIGVMAANEVIVPAIANTLTLRNFTMASIKLIGLEPVAYLGGLNYDVAFYSRRTIPIASAKSAALPGYLFCRRSVYFSMPREFVDRYEIAISSNPTELDGSGEMLLLRKRTRGKRSFDRGLIEAGYDADAARISESAFATRGRTSAEPPRRLKSHTRVISDS